MCIMYTNALTKPPPTYTVDLGVHHVVHVHVHVAFYQQFYLTAALVLHVSMRTVVCTSLFHTLTTLANLTALCILKKIFRKNIHHYFSVLADKIIIVVNFKPWRIHAGTACSRSQEDSLCWRLATWRHDCLVEACTDKFHNLAKQKPQLVKICTCNSLQSIKSQFIVHASYSGQSFVFH